MGTHSSYQLACLSKEMFYLTTHSTHFIYGYMASDIVRKESRCRHIGNSFRLAASVLLYASSHRQDNTYHGLCYTSRGALAQWDQHNNNPNLIKLQCKQEQHIDTSVTINHKHIYIKTIHSIPEPNVIKL